MLPRFLALSVSILSCRLVVTPDLVLVDGQTLEADRTTRVNLVGADTDLGTETVAHAISETRRSVPVDTSGIDGVHEVLSLLLIRSHDAVSVAGAVCVDVLNSLLSRSNSLDRYRERQMLSIVVLGANVDDLGEVQVSDSSLGGAIHAQLNTLVRQRLGDCGENR